MRRLAALAAFVTLVLAAAGCGGDDKSTDTGGGSQANPIAQAAADTTRSGSVKVDFEIKGKGVEGGGRGVFDTGSAGLVAASTSTSSPWAPTSSSSPVSSRAADARRPRSRACA